MSGHFGRDKSVQLLCSKVFFLNIKEKVSQFVNSCESCQRVKVGNKFDKGGEKPVRPTKFNTIKIQCVLIDSW